MADDGVEVGKAVLSVIPVMGSIGKALDGELKKSTGGVASAGKKIGLDLGKGIGAGAKEGAQSFQELERQMAAEAKRTASVVEKARTVEKDATAKLKIEEAKLEELRASGKAKTSQLLAAEQRVEKAKQSSAAASRELTKAEKIAEDQAQRSAAELKKASAQVERSAGGWRSFGSKLKGGLSGGVTEVKKFGRKATGAAKDSGTKAGRGFGSGFGTTLKGVFAGGALLGIVQRAGSALTGQLGEAINQSDATDKFKATLKFAGQSNAQIVKLTKSAQDYADKTVYNLDTIQNATAQLTSNGIKNSDALVRSLGNLNAVAGGNADTFQSVSLVLTQTAGAGKLTTENWNQLANAIPGASGILQKQLKKNGAYVGNFRDAMAKGEITADEFNKAISQTGSTKAAKEAATSTKTIEGAWGNLQAGITGGLAKIITKLKPFITGAINGLSGVVEWLSGPKGLAKAFGGIGKAVQPAIDTVKLFIGSFTGKGADVELPWMDKVIDFGADARTLFDQLKPAIGDALGLLASYFSGGASGWLSVLKSAAPMVSGLVHVVVGLAKQILPLYQQIFGTVIGLVQKVLPIVFKALAGIMSAIKENLPQLKKMFGQIGEVISQLATTIVPILQAILPPALAVFRVLFGTAIKIISSALKVISGVLDVLRGIFTGNFGLIKQGVGKILGGLVGIIMALLKGLVKTLGVLLKTLVKLWLAEFKTLYKLGVSALSALWGWIKGTFSKWWSGLTQMITHPFQTAKLMLQSILGKKGMEAVMSAAVKAAGKIWDGLQAAVGKPIKFVIDTVLNKGLIQGGINWLLKKLHVPDKALLPWIPVPSALKGFRTGGSTGPLPKDRIAGVVHGNEHVATAEEVAKTPGGHGTWDRIRGAIRSGHTEFLAGLGQYRGGGRVWPTNTHSLSASYPGHSGVDIAAGMGAPIYAPEAGQITYTGYGRGYGQAIFERFNSGLQAVFGHTSQVLASVGQAVSAGQLIGRVGSTGNSTGPHLHFEVDTHGWASAANRADSLSYLNGASMSGADSGGGFFSKVLGFLKGLNPIEWLKKRAEGLTGSLASTFGGTGNPLVAGLSKVPGMLIEKGADWIKSVLFGGGAEPSGSGVGRWAPVIRQALAMNGMPTTDDYVNAWLRQVQTESDGDAGAVQQISDINSASGNHARGLLQVVPTTFAAFKFPGHDNIMDGLDNALAAINYWKHRYNGNLSVIGVGHGYAKGVKHAKKGPALVGEEGPEIVVFKGGERVIPHKQSVKLAKSNSTFAHAVDWVNDSLKAGITGTAAKLTSTLKTLRAKIEQAFNAAKPKSGLAVSAAFVKKYKKDTSKLGKLVQQRATLADKIKAAQQGVKDAKANRSGARADIVSAFGDLGSVTGGATTGAGIIAGLKSNLANAKLFASNLARLRKMGLNTAAYSQIVAAGPDGGLAITKALLQGGASTTQAVNSLQSQINKVGGSFGTTASGVMYKAGVDSAQGLLNGLQSKDKALAKAANSLANKLVGSVKKKLGIHSPSRVFYNEVGVNSVLGWRNALVDGESDIAAAGARLARASVASPGVYGVSYAKATSPVGGGQQSIVYVQSPWGPEYMQAKTAEVANGQIRKTAVGSRTAR